MPVCLLAQNCVGGVCRVDSSSQTEKQDVAFTPASNNIQQAIMHGENIDVQGVTVVIISSDGCLPCAKLHSAIAQSKELMTSWENVNVFEWQLTGAEENFSSSKLRLEGNMPVVPQVMFFKNGLIKKIVVGYQPDMTLNKLIENTNKLNNSN